mgnify:FL=1
MTYKTFTQKYLAYVLLWISLLIGMYYALPLRFVVTDEMYFVGGVLKSLEKFSLLPQETDVPYGTLTYYLNYLLISIFLVILMPIFKFKIAALKTRLIQKPELISWVPRFASFLLSFFYLFFASKLLAKEVPERKSRIFLLIILFTNMIFSAILHTGKMWVLSTLLVFISFFYLYEAVCG